MFGAIAGGIASALAGGAMSKLFGGGQKAASGGIQGDVLATDNNTVGMGDAGIKSAIQGSNVPNPNEPVPSFVSGAMAKAGKGLLEGTLQAGTSAVSDKLLDLVGLGGKSAADKGKDNRDYLAAACPELNAWERAGADASSAGMVDSGIENQKEITKMKLDTFFFSSRRRHTRSKRDWSSDVCSSDLLAPTAQAEVASEIEGRLVAIEADLGDRVHRDQVLARVREDEIQAKLREAEASLEKAAADEGRGRPLRGGGVISAQEYEQVRTALEVARARRDQLRIQLERAAIRSPLEGSVAARLIDAGSYVKQGTVVFRLVQDDPLKFRGDVPERDVPILAAGQ